MAAALKEGMCLDGEHGRIVKDRLRDGLESEAKYLSEGPYVMIKLPDGKGLQFKKEREVYQLSFMRYCPLIRAHLDTIHLDDQDEDAMVYGWMDTTFGALKTNYRDKGSFLPQLVAREILKALEVVHSNGWIHADVHPNNIFLSGVGTSNPTVKLGDFGHAWQRNRPRIAGFRPQGVTFRAPEAWKGIKPSPKIDIWGLGVSLTFWLCDKSLFGIQNDQLPDPNHSDALCVGKIIRLCGDIGLPWDTSPFYDEIKMGANMAYGGYSYPIFGEHKNYNIQLGTLREELEASRPLLEPACVDFLEYLLNVDPDQRPSATEALQHPWLCLQSPSMQPPETGAGMRRLYMQLKPRLYSM